MGDAYTPWSSDDASESGERREFTSWFLAKFNRIPEAGTYKQRAKAESMWCAWFARSYPDRARIAELEAKIESLEDEAVENAREIERS